MEPGKRPSPRPSRSDRPAYLRCMNRIRTIAILTGWTLFFPALSSGSDISLRISSGLGWLKAHEINRALTSWREGWVLRAESDPELGLEGRTGRFLHVETDFEAELLLSFSRWLALGVSAGYAYASLDEEQTLVSTRQEGIVYEQARPTKISAYPVFLSIYLSLPISKKVNVYIRGGGGAVFASYVVREANKKAGTARYTYTTYNNATARRWSYLGSIGLSYAVDPSIGFFVEAAARWAQVSGFVAEDDLGGSSRLYTYEEYQPDIDFWQLRTSLHPEEPGGSSVRNVREATVDFSGYSARIGIFLKF